MSDLFGESGHDYIMVGNRRWGICCNTYQVFAGNRWRDSKEMIGPWPGYSRTQNPCPGISEDGK